MKKEYIEDQKLKGENYSIKPLPLACLVEASSCLITPLACLVEAPSCLVEASPYLVGASSCLVEAPTRQDEGTRRQGHR